MNILLVCAAGASTSIVVNNIKKELDESEKVWVIEAKSSSTVKEVAGKYDIILVAPQVRFQRSMIEKICQPLGVKVLSIDPVDYGMSNGKNILNQIRKNI